MIVRWLCAMVLALGLGAGTGVLTSTWAADRPDRQEPVFPHDRHQGLFPVCTGCHAGIESDVAESRFPPEGQCVGCHDGVARSRVEWDGSPTHRVSNVVFDHVEHVSMLTESGDTPATCADCHTAPGEGSMSVDGSEELTTCWGCHAHARDDHFAPTPVGAEAAGCANCHVEAGPDSPPFPRPGAHEGDNFLLSGHGAELEAEVGRCATCHTVERCAACHVEVDRPALLALPAGGVEDPTWSARYPTPPSHEQGWADDHAEAASGPSGSCATCHTSDDCRSCHVDPAPSSVSRIPSRSQARAPGVDIRVEAPPSHLDFVFPSAHATLAAAEPSSCATCHTETYCVQCHDAPTGASYHDPDYLARHATDGWGRDTECASCHETAVFCRACHVESGLGSVGRLGSGYHDAEPLFLLRHGEPARQNLESCASCHEQSDCVQCHGVTGAFQVSPHRAGFDAAAAWNRAPETCLACHLTRPIGVGGA